MSYGACLGRRAGCQESPALTLNYRCLVAYQGQVPSKSLVSQLAQRLPCQAPRCPPPPPAGQLHGSGKKQILRERQSS